MKKLLPLILLLSVQAAISSYTLPQGSHTVYICASPAAKAYHVTRKCKGLQRCTHEIKALSEGKAISAGYKKCKVCDKKK